MLQTEVLQKVYESLIFMIPKLNVKHRKVIEDHISQAYAAGYELGLQNKNRQIPVVLLKDGVVINRYPNIEYAAQSIGKTTTTIRNYIYSPDKTFVRSKRLGYEWKFEKGLRDKGLMG